MTCNLLCRLQGIVEAVYINVTGDAPLLPNVIPSGHPGSPLRHELLECISRFGLLPATAGMNADAIEISIGPGDKRGLRACGAGWVGGIARSPLSLRCEDSQLPFGPYLAACFAAAEIFRQTRFRVFEPTEAAFFDAWSMSPSSEPFSFGLPSIDATLQPLTLAGAGAVGTAWLHSLWAAAGATLDCDVIDSDDKGIDRTNLNRYCLFGTDDIGAKKAAAASKLLRRPGFRLTPHQCRAEEMDRLTDVLVCAVDGNTSRENIQARYLPVTLMASTYNLRAEVLRCTQPGENACLRCYNPPPAVESDDDLLNRLREDPARAKTAAAAAGIAVSDALALIHEPRCGEPTQHLLNAMRLTEQEQATPQFAVGFVSASAGVLLAAETLKMAIAAAPTLNATANRMVLQFFRPAANHPPTRYARDAHCRLCAPGIPLTVWSKRFQQNPYNATMLRSSGAH